LKITEQIIFLSIVVKVFRNTKLRIVIKVDFPHTCNRPFIFIARQIKYTTVVFAQLESE
jgi:hypothetical protein